MGIPPHLDTSITSIHLNNNSVGNGTEMRMNHTPKEIEPNRRQRRKIFRQYKKRRK